MYAQMTKTLEAIEWPGTEENASSGAATILYVEDEAFVREVTCEVLRSAGYRVLSAKNAAEATRMYEKTGCDVELLLSDVVLPGESGLVLAGKLRRANPQLKILLVTGYPEQMGVQDAMHAECLAKPFSSEVLLERVRGLLDRVELPIPAEPLLTHACGAV